jgi:hypothetical protein
MVRFIIAVSLLLATATGAQAATYYISASGGSDSYPGTSAEPWATFAHAFSVMGGGSTLILKDGTYNQSLRDIPEGSEAAYTVVKAENDFQVTVRATIDAALTTSSYNRIEGIKFDGGGSHIPGVIPSNYVKIMRCAFFGAPSNNNSQAVTTVEAHHILFEDCWAWGAGRYKFVAYHSEKVIFRRCVSRHDYANDNDDQCATFTNYDSVQVLYQNVIALDSGQDKLAYGDLYGGIWYENNGREVNDVKVQGSIFINIEGSTGAFADPKVMGAHELENVVVWNANGGAGFENYYGGGSPSYAANHVTMGDIWGEWTDSARAQGTGFFNNDAEAHSPPLPATVTNSILYQVNSYGLSDFITSDYNDFFDNGQNYLNPASQGTHDRFVDPGIMYPVRVEEGSPLKGAASDGGDIGATILRRYGVTGTLWGEPGYDQLTSEPLWPYPYEAQIKADMASWTGPHDGTRGFCAPGSGLYGGPITLTSYIWEAAGHACPVEICGSASPSLTIDDGSESEGDSGSNTLTFAVALDGPAPAATPEP